MGRMGGIDVSSIMSLTTLWVLKPFPSSSPITMIPVIPIPPCRPITRCLRVLMTDGGVVAAVPQSVNSSYTNTGDRFGTSIALNYNGLWLAVGAPGYDVGSVGGTR
jgi:hypothetical protein